MTDGDLDGILHRTLKVTCAACGTELPPRSETCSACGAAIDEDDEDAGALSLVAADPAGPSASGKKSLPLERAKNYIALRDAAERVLSGALDADSYRATLQRIKSVATTGLKVLQSDVARARFGSLPANEKAAAERMERGFQALHDGIVRMGRYLESGDAADVREGWAEADRGWIDIDGAQDMAQEISEERDT